MTLATSALPGRWRVGSVEVAGAAVRPRALLVRRGTGQAADGAAGADRQVWFGEVRVEGEHGRGEAGDDARGRIRDGRACQHLLKASFTQRVKCHPVILLAFSGLSSPCEAPWGSMNVMKRKRKNVGPSRRASAGVARWGTTR